MEKLTEIIEYDPATGIFKWKVGGRKRQRGEKAGSTSGQGYNRITINWIPYRGARLAWYLTYGYWPKEVDHINGNKADDRLSNLREVTRAENNINTKARTISGTKGVYWNARYRNWEARATRNGKSKYLGRFVSREEAVEARNKHLEEPDVI